MTYKPTIIWRQYSKTHMEDPHFLHIRELKMTQSNHNLKFDTSALEGVTFLLAT